MATTFDYERPSVDDLDGLSRFQTASIHEAMGQRGAMPSYIKPIYPGMRLSGAALTVDCAPGDNLMIHAAVERARPGDVLVIDFKGYVEAGPFGDVLAEACRARGVVGVVIDGCVRDGRSLREQNFPVFARGLSMKGTTKRIRGRVAEPILCAGVPVAPGDAVVGDDDGVVVVPRALVAATIEKTAARERKEEALREELRNGASTVDHLGLRPILDGKV